MNNVPICDSLGYMYVFYRFRPKGTLQVQRLANLIILNANTMHMMKLNYLFLYDEI